MQSVWTPVRAPRTYTAAAALYGLRVNTAAHRVVVKDHAGRRAAPHASASLQPLLASARVTVESPLPPGRWGWPFALDAPPVLVLGHGLVPLVRAQAGQDDPRPHDLCHFLALQPLGEGLVVDAWPWF